MLPAGESSSRGAVLEIIGKLTTFVFDKTGTLTYGTPTVRSVRGFSGVSENEVLRLAGTAEKHSEHPLADAILKQCKEKEAWPLDRDKTEVIVGRGIVAGKDGKEIMVGNQRLFEEKGIPLTPDAQTFLSDVSETGSTGVLVGHDGRIVGGIGIADVLKADVRQSIEDIRKVGIKKVLMLTGHQKGCPGNFRGGGPGRDRGRSSPGRKT